MITEQNRPLLEAMLSAITGGDELLWIRFIFPSVRTTNAVYLWHVLPSHHHSSYIAKWETK